MNRFDRSRVLLGDGMDRLADCHVVVFGVGGVGSYVVEALARCGVGRLTVVDDDVVDVTNINRQLIALSSTVGKPKVEVAQSRILDINPACRVSARQVRISPENAASFFENVDYAVDAIDCVTAKIALIQAATETSVPILSSMGTGNKLDPEKLTITDLAKTHACPLARVMRQELKKRGIVHLPVLFSPEEPVVKRRVPGSVSFVPSVGGLLIAGKVIRDLTKNIAPSPMC